MTIQIIEQVVESLEGFSEAEEESLFMAEELEYLPEFEQEENLESIQFETVAEDMEAYFYEAESSTQDVNQRMLKVMTAVVKHMVTKISYNPKARIKLQAACERGSNAVAQLLLPSMKKHRFPLSYNGFPLFIYLLSHVLFIIRFAKNVEPKIQVKMEEMESQKNSNLLTVASKLNL
ncbi:MAG: hypothetical protein HC917_05490 [Richelia sp. SM2_1_7]|nr:hypothetical protein [Richelia sp. SM2_1_7]